MSTLLKSKYNSTGIRCVDACLKYGELRYKTDNGTPSKIEVPIDKYDDAVAEFEQRLSAGMSDNIRPTDVIIRGSVTYNQIKSFVEECKIRGMNYFPLDGSIDCDSVLGISGVVEYAIARWDGNDRITAIRKGILRCLSIHGEDFVKALKIDNASDESKCTSFAKNTQSTPEFGGLSLYKIERFDLGGEIFNAANQKKSIKLNLNEFNFDEFKKSIDPKEASLFLLVTILSFVLLQISTNFRNIFGNMLLYIVISLLVSLLLGIIAVKLLKSHRNKSATSSNNSIIIELFNQVLEVNVYQYMLTQNEIRLILRNIIQGELYKLLAEMKGSVNKKSSINIIMEKQVAFIVSSRVTVTIPGKDEIKGIFTDLVAEYEGQLSKDYNVANAVDDIEQTNE